MTRAAACSARPLTAAERRAQFRLLTSAEPWSPPDTREAAVASYGKQGNKATLLHGTVHNAAQPP